MATQNLTRKNGRHKVKEIEAFDTVLDVSEIDVSADVYQLAVLPPKTLIKRVSMIVVTPNDAATSAVADVGVDGDSSLVSAFDLTGAAGVTSSDGDIYLENGGILTYLPTYTGTPTEGKVILHVEYSEIGKASGNFTQFIKE